MPALNSYMMPAPTRSARVELRDRLMKKPPPSAGAKQNAFFSLAARHASSRTLVRIDRNQKSVPVGVGELVPLDIGAVIERAVHFKPVIVLGPEIVDVL